MTIPHGAGALYSTTGDLLRWVEGLFGGKLLSAESLRKMTTPFLNNYAYGLEVLELDGRKTIRHGGGIQGFNTLLAYYPGERITVVALANLNGNTPTIIARQLAAVAHGDTVLPQDEKQKK
jgi:CubicO group peptidase (beta-lactamase class C family)